MFCKSEVITSAPAASVDRPKLDAGLSLLPWLWYIFGSEDDAAFTGKVEMALLMEVLLLCMSSVELLV